MIKKSKIDLEQYKFTKKNHIKVPSNNTSIQIYYNDDYNDDDDKNYREYWSRFGVMM